MSNYLPTQPYKGARDFYPEEMRIQRYIIDTMRKTCILFGFEEYDFPIVENFEVFASKTGEEIVNTQLYSFEDRGGRKIALRPELTPSTVRMIAAKYNELIKPIKWFAIANNWRYEKPQKGRGREFYQLEANIFGVPGPEADFEIFNLAISIMQNFGATEKMFVLKYSDRRLISLLLIDFLGLGEQVALAARRIMDKRAKVSQQEFISMLVEVNVSREKAMTIDKFMSADSNSLDAVIPKKLLAKNEGYTSTKKLEELLAKFDLMKYCKFDPSIIRGFDYSDGLVYEVFDKNPENSRSMYGGERFDRLINVFGNFNLAATGFGMGDVTMLEFLKGWKLLPNNPSLTKVLVTMFSEETKEYSLGIASKLREIGITTDTYLQPDKLDKQLKYADRKQIPFVIIAGPEEIEKGIVIVKNLAKREQVKVELEEIKKQLFEA